MEGFEGWSIHNWRFDAPFPTTRTATDALMTEECAEDGASGYLCKLRMCYALSGAGLKHAAREIDAHHIAAPDTDPGVPIA